MIIAWFLFAFLVGLLGTSRKIGFWAAFLLSLILSPLIGFIFTIISKTDRQAKYEHNVLMEQMRQTEAIRNLQNRQPMEPPSPPPMPPPMHTPITASLADELAKLKSMYDVGALTAEEYEAAKRKLLG